MKFYTCTTCESIGNHKDVLDDKPICESCLHKKFHGDDVYERCEKRGYHETNSHGGEIRQRQEGDEYFFHTTIHCLCGKSVSTWLKSRGPDLTSVEWLTRNLIPMPKPSQFWTLVEGIYTPVDPEQLKPKTPFVQACEYLIQMMQEETDGTSLK